MEFLEILYEEPIPKEGFGRRKIDLAGHVPCNLAGHAKSGRSSLLFSHLSNLPKESFLYIDCNDLRLLDPRPLLLKLPAFIAQKGIRTVALDNFDPAWPLPLFQEMIVVTQKPLNSTGFSLMTLRGFDLEEFMALYKKQLDAEHAFARFLRQGTLPALLSASDPQLRFAHHAAIRSLFYHPLELSLFRVMSRFMGAPVSKHQLYQGVKRTHKASKDRLYLLLEDFEARRLLYWLPKFDQPGAAKKLILFDFALPASILPEKSLIKELQNMIALELIGRGTELFYLDHIDFYLPRHATALIVLPFGNASTAAQRLAKVKKLESLALTQIYILTVSSHFSFTFDGHSVEALPIYEWAMQL